MIEYPVDVENTRWTVYQISTESIMDRGAVWPNSDGSPIVGLDPDFIYLLEQVDAIPAFDPRLYSLTYQEGIDVEANTIHKSWVVVPRPIDERVQAAENEETNQLARHISLHRELIETRLVISALIFHLIDGQQLPPAAQAMIDEFKATGVKVWQNRDALRNIITALEAGEDANMDDVWVEP